MSNLLTDTSSSHAPAVPAPPLRPAKTSFYSTFAQAHTALQKAGAGQAIRYTPNGGYYLGAPLPKTPPPKNPGPGAGAGAGTKPTQLSLAQQAVSAYIDPIIQQIQKVEEARAQAGQQAITGYTQAEQQLLQNQSPLAAAAYGGAMQGQNAIDNAIASRVQGQGDANANALAGKLAAISADPGTAARLNAQASGNAAGAAGAGYASNSATLSALNQEGAANQGYLRSLPGIQALSGLQSSRDLQSQVNQDEQTQLGSVTQNVPGMVQSQLASQASAQANAAKLAEQAREADNKNTIASLIASGRYKEALQVAQENTATKTGIANANNTTRANIATANNNTKTSIAAGNNATKLQVAQANARAKAAAAAGKQPTPNDVSKLVDSWYGGKPSSVTTIPKNKDGTPKYTDSRGNPKSVTQTVVSGQLQYGQAYKRLRAMNVPDEKAREYLNSAYKRGQYGRSWVTNTEQVALSKAGLPSKAKVINGHGVLSAAQYQALHKAGLTVPGQLTAEGAFVIAQVN